jgi:hypothetical protein
MISINFPSFQIHQFQIENIRMDAEPGEDNVSNETENNKDATTATSSKEEESTSTTPGSGVWEKSENKRWVVVMDTNHRIPSRNRTRSEGSLDPSLSIHSFVSRFEVEEQQPGNYNVISDGSSLVRIDRVEDMEEDPAVQGQEEDPMEGSSGSQTRRVNARARRRSSHLSSPEQNPPPPPPNVETVQSKGRRKRRRRRRKKVFLLSGNFIGRKKKWKREVILSVESSPGRDSPSPDTLRRIVERGLVVEGEEMTVMEEVVEEEADITVSRLEVSNSVDEEDRNKSDTEDIPRD